MSDGSVKVPLVTVAGKEVDCEVISRGGIDYYKQRTNSASHYLDTATGLDTPQRGDVGFSYSMDYISAISRGKVPGASIFSSNGDHSLAAAVTDAPVHVAGVVNISLTGAQMSFVSSSANDAAAGTGLRTLLMSYIEHSTLAAKTEVITMNGATPVLSVATNVRFINSLTMLTAGSGGKNAGTITVTSGGVTYGAMTPGNRVQMSSFRMVPAGKVFIPRVIVASSISALNQSAQTTFHIVGWSDSVPYWIPSNAVGCSDVPIVVPLGSGRAIPAGSAFGLEVTTDKAAHVTGSMIGHLEDA